MFKRITAYGLPCSLLLTGMCAFGQQAQNGPPAAAPEAPRTTASTLPDNPQSLAHKEAAKRLAGNDPMLTKAWNFFCTPTPYNEPGPEVDAAKVFDNLYAIPSSPVQQTMLWAITTSDGIILIDSGQQGRTEAILAELKQVGLDPANVKYILLGHGHGDHYASALYFQEHFGTRVGLSAADWDVLYPAKPAAAEAPNAVPKPKRDLVIKEGTPVQLGDQTVHVIDIPGHTPGSVGFIFNVRERGETHTAGMFGGTILDQGRISVDGLNQYVQSINHFLEAAKKMKVDVEIQNHALFDDTPGRLARLKARKAGEPNPFLMTTTTYANMWNLVSECIQAEAARRPPAK